MNQPVGLLDICGGLCDDPSRIVGKPSVGFDGFDTKMIDCWRCLPWVPCCSKLLGREIGALPGFDIPAPS